jgi:hypothetical protein
MDYEAKGHIVDDVRNPHSNSHWPDATQQLMHDILVKTLPAGCRLTAIFDVGLHFHFVVSVLVNTNTSEVLSFRFSPG